MTLPISSVASTDLLDTVRQISQSQKSMESFAPKGIASTKATGEAPSFGDMLSDLLQGVDKVSKKSQADTNAVLTGQSNNIHQAMLSMQESGVAFSLMTEVRNKLVNIYQELMRMQV